jgi:hypothetical protein
MERIIAGFTHDGEKDRSQVGLSNATLYVIGDFFKGTAGTTGAGLPEWFHE